VTAVELTPLRLEDSPLLFEWINDRDLVVLSAPYRPVSRAEHDLWFEQIRLRDDVRIFGIREGGRLVGTCQLHSIHAVHRSAELQIRIGALDARGRGIGMAATVRLLEIGFRELDLHRICLHVFATNEAARRLYERVGFRIEGVLREAAWLEPEWVDVLLMAILDTEFDAA
jgi:RimJ/RimL family protein N-acetyltransferase